ncbi:MAG: threonylcarbamoyl-AMP synthase [Hyphomicrobiales bacterium]|nr:threonylcarbamoyl-AMP synthase [Hyphomicrobiales bacterium]
MAANQTRTQCEAADESSIRAAAASLRGGGLVAMPTETVYGLAADATSDKAVARLFAAKGRPAFNPLIAHVLDLEAARRHGRFTREAEMLAEAFWPGPLTLVLPVAPSCRISLLARAGLDTIALRVPAHETARALIQAAGTPLAAPSANRSGRVSPTTAAHVLADLDGEIDWILDGGPSRYGLESTIVACLEPAPTMLRSGAVSREAIEASLGAPLGAAVSQGSPSAPGQLRSHYAPRARLRLNAVNAAPDEAALDFGGALSDEPSVTRLDLSPSGDMTEAAANLFAHLRALDEVGARRIAVAPVPLHGLGEAINDRLERAAAPRDRGGPTASNRA